MSMSFNGMQQNYSAVKMDDDSDEDGPRVGSLLDLSGPATSTNQTNSAYQGAQGASLDTMLSQAHQSMAPQKVPVQKPNATGSLFDEDDIMGVIGAQDPL